MKPVQFEGDSLKRLRGFPREVRHDLGLQLYRLQLGRPPADFKPMSVIGPGVEEIPVRDASGAYRVIYTASKQDIELAATRFAALLRRNR